MRIQFLGIPLIALAMSAFTLGPMIAQEEKEEKEKVEKADDKDQESEEEEEPEEEEVSFKSLEKKYNDAMAEFSRAYSKAETDAEKGEIFRELYPDKGDYAEDVFSLVEEDPKSEDSAVALSWLMRGARDDKVVEKVISLLFEHHVESEGMTSVAATLSRQGPSESNEKRMWKILEKSPHDKVKGMTAFYLISYNNRLAASIDDEEMLERMEQFYGEEVIDYVKSKSRESIDADVSELIDMIKNDYADVEYRGEVTLGDKLEAVIFEKENLQIGMKVPDIEGEDIDGVEFKLSDYEGKVVVIDFWGDW